MRNRYSGSYNRQRFNRDYSNNKSLWRQIYTYLASSLAIRGQERDIDNIRRHRPDYQLIMIMGVLLALGMIVIYAVSPALSYGLLGDYSENYFLKRQLFNTLAGVVGFIVASQIPLKVWRKILPIMVVITVISLIALFVPGLAISEKGATRWIGFGPFSFQPAELMKLTTIFYLAFYLASKTVNDLRDASKTIIPIAILLGVLGFIVVVIQRDLGTMMALVVITIGMLFLSGVPIRHMLSLVGVMFAGAVVSIIMFPHRVERLMTFLNPGSDIQNTGFHVHQALLAIGSGGLFGLGLGHSVQVYGYLPEAANDSIFAVWAEKFGFIGTIFILSLFSFLIYKLFLIVRDIKNPAARLLAAGVMLWFSGHVIINTTAMLGLIPLTGITLPFLSYGGSSLLFMMIALGIAFNLSRYTERTAARRAGSVGQWSRV